jgi:hypothetical protein
MLGDGRDPGTETARQMLGRHRTVAEAVVQDSTQKTGFRLRPFPGRLRRRDPSPCGSQARSGRRKGLNSLALIV